MLKRLFLGIIFTLVCIDVPADIGVVGDSGITGAATDPRLEANSAALAQAIIGVLNGPSVETSPLSRVLGFRSPGHTWPRIEDYTDPAEFGITDPIDGITRIFYSESEITEKKTVVSHNMDARGSMKLDVEEYSFPYMVGRALGVPAENIYFAAQDGKRVGEIAKQMNRFFVAPEIAERGTLPELIFVFFTANNMCHEENLTRTVDESVGFYRDSLVEQFNGVFSKFKPNANGTRIVLVAPIDATQIFHNQELLEAPVKLEGKLVQCKDFRRPYSQAQKSLLAQEIIKGLEKMCPAILRTDVNDTARIGHLRSIMAGFVDVQSELVQEWQAKLPAGFTFEHFRSTFDMRFQAGDTANDCFHPGIRAHEKIAREFLNLQ